MRIISVKVNICLFRWISCRNGQKDRPRSMQPYVPWKIIRLRYGITYPRIREWTRITHLWMLSGWSKLIFIINKSMIYNNLYFFTYHMSSVGTLCFIIWVGSYMRTFAFPATGWWVWWYVNGRMNWCRYTLNPSLSESYFGVVFVVIAL